MRNHAHSLWGKIFAVGDVREEATARVIEINTRTYEFVFLGVLKQLGILRTLMEESSIKISELARSNELDSYNLWATLDFLASLGYLHIDDAKNNVWLTPLGAGVFRRAGAFQVPRAYLAGAGDTFTDIIEVLRGRRPLTRRDLLSDIQGAGQQNHAYFEAAASAYVAEGIEAIVDMGMGDGSALIYSGSLNRHRPTLRYVGTDFHSIAVEEGARRLGKAGVRAHTFQANFKEPEALAGKLRELGIDPMRIALTSFFILEEVIGRDGEGMRELLDRYYENIGPIFAFGEIYTIDWRILANCGGPTTVPVYSLIHRLSPQEILSREQTFAIIDESRWRQAAFHPIGRVGRLDKEQYSAGGVHVLKKST